LMDWWINGWGDGVLEWCADSGWIDGLLDYWIGGCFKVKGRRRVERQERGLETSVSSCFRPRRRARGGFNIHIFQVWRRSRLLCPLLGFRARCLWAEVTVPERASSLY
jgi:hypothetical protein